VADPSVISSEVINFGGGSNPSAQTATVPSGCNTVVVKWAYYDSGGSGYGLASLTLDGDNADFSTEDPGNGNVTGLGVNVWYNPSIGDLDLDPAWDESPNQGPICCIWYLQDVDTATGHIDVDIDQATTGGDASVTLTGLESGMLVLKLDTRDQSSAPGNSSGWTSDETQTVSGMSGRGAHIVATGSSQNCPSENESYSALIGIAFAGVGGVDHELLADDLESASEVGSPAVGQVHALLADDLESASAVSAPAVGQVHALLANDLESASEVGAPAITQIHALLADDLEALSQLSLPALVSASLVGHVPVHVVAAAAPAVMVVEPGIGSGTNRLPSSEPGISRQITGPDVTLVK